MSLFVGIAVAAFALFAYGHLLGALLFETWLRRQSTLTPAQSETSREAKSEIQPGSANLSSAGHIAVLACSRGNAPHLFDMLQAITTQDYPDYQVVLVVDQSDDQNWEKLQTWKASNDSQNRLTLAKLEKVRMNCGLKCSALLTALDHVRPTAEFVALIDCDVIPRPDWLKQLTVPLRAPEIGVVTGGQWYEPEPPWQLGSSIRSLWNAGAIVPTWMLANPWAGSLSLRYRDLTDSGLIDLWGQSVVDDGPIRACLGQLYRRICFSTELIAVNRETCSSSFVINYVTRMMTWSRWYEKTFINTTIHAVMTTAVWAMLILATLVSLLRSDWPELLAISAGLAFAGLSMVLSYQFVRGAVFRAVGKMPQPLGWQFWLLSPVLIAVTQAVFCWAVLNAWIRKRVTWRQATYTIHGPQRVRLEKYEPYRSSGHSPNHSI